jgi:hypothetical protein
MELQRLAPTARGIPKTRYLGRCSACERPIKHRDSIVHMYGEAFHQGCAFYRHTRNGTRYTDA